MTSSHNIRKRNLFELAVTVVAIFLVYYIGTYSFKRFDLTSEKRFTLSPSTIDMLESLQDAFYIKVFLDGDYPADYKKLKKETLEKLEEFRAYAGDNIQFEFINVFKEKDEQQLKNIIKQLIKSGLKPKIIPIKEDEGQTTKEIFPGAIISYGNKEIALQLVEGASVATAEDINRSIGNLEYLFTNTFKKLLMPRKPNIAFTQGHGELDKDQVGIMVNALHDFANIDFDTLNGNVFELSTKGIKDTTGSTILTNKYDLIIIAKPIIPFSEQDQFLIDQFIMHNGKVIWLIDQLNAEIDTSMIYHGQTWALTRDLKLDDLLFNYGVRINKNLIIDKICAPINIPGNNKQLYPWYFYPMISANTDHPIVSNLNPIKLQFASTIDTVATKGIKKTILLTTSNHSIIYNPPVRINYKIISIDPNFTQTNNKPNLTAAVLLEGSFTSPFKDRLPDSFTNNFRVKYQSNNSKMIIIGDGDIIRNVVDTVQRPDGSWGIGYYPIDREYLERNFQEKRLIYGNKEFLLNSIDYLLNDESMLTIRSRSVTLRLLNAEKLDKEKSYWQFINIAGPLVIILIIGTLQFIIRKRKYNK